MYIEVRCPDMRINDTVIIKNQIGKYRFMDNIIMECILGYELITGDLISTCQHNRTWNGTIPICKSLLKSTICECIHTMHLFYML